MTINRAFLVLIDNNVYDFSDVQNTIESITKRLNKAYYGIDDSHLHTVIAGSVGRKTAIDDSDLDFCFVLPDGDYERFNKHSWNIQSQLLNEIKQEVQSRFPQSEIKQDGQVVELLFRKSKMELVPIFKKGDDYVFPNTHNGGKWDVTNPYKQIQKANQIEEVYPAYKNFCKIVRCWNREVGCISSGILIDCLVYEFFKINNDYTEKELFDYLGNFRKFLEFLTSPLCPFNVEILGENNRLYTKKDTFSKKANKSLQRLNETDIERLWDNLITLFGYGFPQKPDWCDGESEHFINKLFREKINNSYVLKIDCKITNNRFGSLEYLQELLGKKGADLFIEHGNSLDFYITECDVPEPYDIYWKVRNVGAEARRRGEIRGSIFKGEKKHHEKSQFRGPHYVECYIIKNGVCVAKDRIDVPIE